jgi:hypothetical protein
MRAPRICAPAEKHRRKTDVAIKTERRITLL